MCLNFLRNDCNVIVNRFILQKPRQSLLIVGKDPKIPENLSKEIFNVYGKLEIHLIRQSLFSNNKFHPKILFTLWLFRSLIGDRKSPEDKQQDIGSWFSN